MADTIDTASISIQLNAMAKSMQELVAAQSGYARNLRDYTGELDDTNDSLEKFQKDLDNNKKLTDAQRKVGDMYVKTQKEANETLRKANIEQNKLLKLQQSGSQQTNTYQQTQQRVQTLQKEHALQQSTANAIQNKFQKSTVGVVGGLGKLGSVIGTVAKGFNVLMFVVALVAERLDKAKVQMANNIGFIEDLGQTGSAYDALLQQRMMAIGRNIKPEELAKMSAQFRNVIMASGGLEKTLTITDNVSRDFYGMTGDMSKATELAMQAMQNFATSGVWPTGKALRAYTDDVNHLSAATGMAADQVMQLYKEVADDESSRVLLKAAREDEREAIIASQRALVNMSQAAGMTAEQAKEAAKMLNKMVAAKPLERIKQAAKIRALGAAMGVGGANEAAQALIAGPRATADQKQQLMQFNQSLTGVLDQARGQGLGAEIFATTLTDKLGLEEHFGASSPFTTTLGTVVKEGTKNSQAQINISQSQLATAMLANDYLKNIAENTDDMLEYFVNKLGSMFSKVLGDWVTVLVSGIAAPFQAMLGKLAQLLGNIPGLGSIAKWGDEMWKNAGESASTFLHGTPEMQKENENLGKLPSVVLPTAGKPGKGNAMSTDLARPATTQVTNQLAENQIQQTSSIDMQLKKMDENNITLKQIMGLLTDANELYKQQLIAMVTSAENEKKTVNITERLGGIRNQTKQYNNVFSTR